MTATLNANQHDNDNNDNDNNEVTMLPVSTVAQFADPQEKPAREPVTVSTRATKAKGEIPADQRTRSILIPMLHVDSVPSKFQMLVLDALRKVAKAQLSALWDADGNLREVPAAIWSVDALLAYAAREAEASRLTKAGIEAWFAQSKLDAFLRAKGDAALHAKWKTTIVSLAAPTLNLNEQQCTTIIKSLERFEGDAESLIGQQLITKLERRIEAIKRQVSEVSIDDLEV